MAASGKYSTRDLLKTIELIPKRDTSSNIVSVAKITPLRRFAWNPLRKYLIESSVIKSVAKVDTPQAFLWKSVEAFLRVTLISEKFDPYKIKIRLFPTISGKRFITTN